MKIWAISDTHFFSNPNYSMDRFGEVWKDHMNQIKAGWRKVVGRNDIVIIGGDISWEHKLEGALVHLRELNDLPGKQKLIFKGNHDTWWKGLENLNNILPKGMTAIQGGAIKIKEQVICGCRGWTPPNDQYYDGLDEKTFKKEMLALQNALEAAMDLEPKEGIHLVTHFPIFNSEGKKNAFYQALQGYPIRSATYGHFHLKDEFEKIPKGNFEGIELHLTSSDYIKHQPVLIWEG